MGKRWAWGVAIIIFFVAYIFWEFVFEALGVPTLVDTEPYEVCYSSHVCEEREGYTTPYGYYQLFTAFLFANLSFRAIDAGSFKNLYEDKEWLTGKVLLLSITVWLALWFFIEYFISEFLKGAWQIVTLAIQLGVAYPIYKFGQNYRLNELEKLEKSEAA